MARDQNAKMECNVFHHSFSETEHFLTSELEYNRWDFKDFATPKLKDCKKI
jgi:hypothetical protein